MATDGRALSDPPSRQDSVVGSETGYPMEDELASYHDHDDFAEPTEETRLLGAGAHDDGDDDDPIPIGNGKDTLSGDPDFEHLPRWRRPSVCRENNALSSHNAAGLPCSQGATSRSGGFSAPTLSSPSPSEVRSCPS